MRKMIPIFTPLILGIIVSLIMLFIKIPDPKIDKIDFVLNAIITSVVTLAGFILTSLTIIIGMSNSAIMKKIIKAGGLSELIIRYTTTMVLSLVLIIVFITFGGLIKCDNLVSSKILIVGCGIITAYLFSLVTTCYYLLLIISRLPADRVEVIKEASVPHGSFRV